MKTFLRKVKLSFLAMLCGWVACNIALWLAYGVAMLIQGEPLSTAYRLDVALIVLGATGLWLIGVWLIIFLPVDLLVSDTSKLRQPKTAALAGLASAALFACGYSCLVITISGLPLDNADARLSAWIVLGTFGFGAVITGTVAAYIRARLDPAITHGSS